MIISLARAPQNPYGKIPVHARWYAVETQSLFGKSIGELSIRKLTGSTILGVRRDGVVVQNPDREFILLEADELYVMGTHAQLAFFERAFGMFASYASTPSLMSLEKKIA
ncbi:MAG: TrkA C-terminal domain-containing protein [Candidatus Melainabacteria bacterium]|nr:TrkA C-terminal domain-containing protein [Candidatus Melainabacteria bacterium]